MYPRIVYYLTIGGRKNKLIIIIIIIVCLKNLNINIIHKVSIFNYYYNQSINPNAIPLYIIVST